MADYKSAIAKVLLTEGGYANDPDDAGGETYRGIARKFWPTWSGWPIIDHAKGHDDFPHCLASISLVLDSVISFYKVNFGDKVGGDFIASQMIANNLVDSAVNEGIKPAVRRAQAIVGLPTTGVIDQELVKRLNSMI